MPYNHQIRINTRILDSNNQVVPIKIISDSNSYSLNYKNIEIGYVMFTVQHNSIYINRMYNRSINTENKLRHVGSALFECVFKKSLELGLKGNVYLNSIEISSAAYYKMEFRKQSDAYNVLEKYINEYIANPSFLNKDKIIKESFSYDELKKEAASYLKKDISAITFDDCITSGRYSKYNQEFEQVLKDKNIVTWSDCYKCGMQSWMYLPEEGIARNIKKFSPDMFRPIGSNRTGDYLSLNSDLEITDERLKTLVKDGILDPANAIEIYAKNPTDEELDIILSPIGLELMSINYISAYYMLVYFRNELKIIISEKFLHYLEDGTISHIEDYIEHPYKYEKLFYSEISDTENLEDNISDISNEAATTIATDNTDLRTSMTTEEFSNPNFEYLEKMLAQQDDIRRNAPIYEEVDPLAYVRNLFEPSELYGDITTNSQFHP